MVEDHRQLIKPHTAVAIPQSAGKIGGNRVARSTHTTATRVDDNKVIAKPVHLQKPEA